VTARVSGVRTLGAVLLTSNELDQLAKRTVRELRRLEPFQRDAITERILAADPALAPVLPELLAICRARKLTRRLGPLVRDSVSH
jgi:hypothetical protein